MSDQARTIGNPVRAVAAWLGWSRDDYMSALAWAPLIAAFAAGAYLSYSSLVFLAEQLGYAGPPSIAYPICIDALLAAAYVGQWRLAGLRGFHSRRLYLIGLGLTAGAFTMSGNMLHGALVWHLLSTPLPFPLLTLGSAVPAVAMIGSGHAVTITLAADRARRQLPAPARQQVPVRVDLTAPERSVSAPRRRAPQLRTAPRRDGAERVRALLGEAHATGRMFDVAAVAREIGLHPQRVRAIRRDWQRDHLPAPARPALVSAGGDRS